MGQLRAAHRGRLAYPVHVELGQSFVEDQLRRRQQDPLAGGSALCGESLLVAGICNRHLTPSLPAVSDIMGQMTHLGSCSSTAMWAGRTEPAAILHAGMRVGRECFGNRGCCGESIAWPRNIDINDPNDQPRVPSGLPAEQIHGVRDLREMSLSQDDFDAARSRHDSRQVGRRVPGACRAVRTEQPFRRRSRCRRWRASMGHITQ